MNKQEWLELFTNDKRNLGNLVARFNGATEAEWLKAISSNDPQIIGEILQRTWENAPDQPYIHDLYGWGTLCDLCSEFVFGDLSE